MLGVLVASDHAEARSGMAETPATVVVAAIPPLSRSGPMASEAAISSAASASLGVPGAPIVPQSSVVARSMDAIGVCSGLTIALVGSFANIYLEKILKGDDTPLLLRNVQLCVFTIPFQLVTIFARGEQAEIFQLEAPCATSWVLVVEASAFGLLVSVMMRFADNNLKNLAQTLATLLTALLSFWLFAFEPTRHFWIGFALIIAATYLYVHDDAKRGLGSLSRG